MKKNNKKYLEDYKSDMITAYFYAYSKNLPNSTLREIERIYVEESGISLNTNFSCGHCVVYLLFKVAQLYYTQYINELPTELQSRFTPLIQQTKTKTKIKKEDETDENTR